MPVETATYISDLNPAWPPGTDPKSQGDDHIRTTKGALKQTFPNVTGAVNASHIEINYLVGVTSPIQAQIALRATKTGDSYTGTHDFSLATLVKLPTATTIGPVTAAEIGYLSGVTSSIQSQFGGVNTALAGKIARSGDTYTGTHNMTGATVTVADTSLPNDTQRAANTKFVNAAIADAVLTATLPGQAGNAGKFITTNGTVASWSFVPWTSVTGTATVMTTDTAQAVSGVKTFTGGIHALPLQQLKLVRPIVTAALSTGNTNWITACKLDTSVYPAFSRFLLTNSARSYFAEIKFSKSAAWSVKAMAEIQVLGAYSYYSAYPAKFRIVDLGTSARFDFCFPGTVSATETIEIVVLEDFFEGDRSASDPITYPLTASGTASGALTPNMLDFGNGAGTSLNVLRAHLHVGVSYAAITDAAGAVGQTTLATNTAAAG